MFPLDKHGSGALNTEFHHRLAELLLRLTLILLVAILTLGPVLAIVIGSFDVSELGAPFRFGLDAWTAMLTERENLDAFIASFVLTVRVPIGLVIAFVIAWLIARVQVPFHGFFEALCWFAYFLPTIPMLSGWILLLDPDFGLLNSLANAAGLTSGPLFDIRTPGGIIWSHLSLQTVPFLVIILLPAMRLLDRTLLDAATVAGAGPWKVLTRIVLPATAPFLMLAGLASWIRAVESFEIEQILGGFQDYFVLTSKIYDYLSEDSQRIADALALSSLFLIVLIVLGLIYQRLLERRGPIQVYSGRSAPVKGTGSKRLRRAGTVALALYFSITLLLPFSMLICGSFMTLFGFFSIAEPWTLGNWQTVLGSSDFYRSLKATLLLGFSTAIPGTLFFALVAWGLARMTGVVGRIGTLLVWLPWAFPGLVLGLGILELSLTMPGLNLFYGSLLPLVVGLIIRDLPIGVHMMRNSIGQADRELTEAAQLAGSGWLRTLWRIVLPINAPALVLVFLLLFSGAITDVGTILLIAPPGMQSLSLLTFNYVSVGNFEAATVVGTIVAFLSLGVALLADRLGRRYLRVAKS